MRLRFLLALRLGLRRLPAALRSRWPGMARRLAPARRAAARPGASDSSPGAAAAEPAVADAAEKPEDPEGPEDPEEAEEEEGEEEGEEGEEGEGWKPEPEVVRAAARVSGRRCRGGTPVGPVGPGSGCSRSPAWCADPCRPGSRSS